MFVDSKSVGVLVFVFVILHGKSVLSQDYCRIESCKRGQHVLCLYPNDEPGPNCQNFQAFELSLREKSDLVSYHNIFRSRVARGYEWRQQTGFLPKASNMRRLRWNDTLEEIAQRWAYQCMDGHDACRNLPYSPVGQNIGTQCNSSAAALQYANAEILIRWYNEANYFDDSVINSYRRDNRTENFTQFIWAYTQYIGCAQVGFRGPDGQFCSRLVCNYASSGNQPGESVYKIGNPASACPNGKDFVRGLCK